MQRLLSNKPYRVCAMFTPTRSHVRDQRDANAIKKKRTLFILAITRYNARYPQSTIPFLQNRSDLTVDAHSGDRGRSCFDEFLLRSHQITLSFFTCFFSSFLYSYTSRVSRQNWRPSATFFFRQLGFLDAFHDFPETM